MPAKKQNYLNNKDILKEIHKSKMSFCWIQSPEYDMYDLILDDDAEVELFLEHGPTDHQLQLAKKNRANRIQAEGYSAAMADHDPLDYRNKPKQKEFAVDLNSIPDSDVVFRVMTYAHIPDEPGRKKNPKTTAEEKAKLNFPPFKHYAQVGGEWCEVARSHWKGDLTSGEFSADHGRPTHKLGTMYLKLVERYSHRANWRGYSYVDEMRGEALLQLSMVGLKFNEARSDNPFAYYTAAVRNCFTRVLNLEKKNQELRDDILVDQGHMPSYTRQMQHEEDIRRLREEEAEDL